MIRFQNLALFAQLQVLKAALGGSVGPRFAAKTREEGAIMELPENQGMESFDFRQ